VNRFRLARYSVVYEPPDDDPFTPRDLAVPIIDGTPLFEAIGDRHPGLVVHLVAPPSRQWLGRPSYVEYGRAVVLDGSCGIAECCGVVARIDIGETTVSWSDFAANGLPDLPSGLHFTFDRGEYERAIAEVASLEPTTWIIRNDLYPARTGQEPARARARGQAESMTVIAIGGSASVGKTTLARAIAERLAIEKVVHVDDLRTAVERSDGPGFIETTPGVWTRPASWLLESLLASTRSLHPAITAEIDSLVELHGRGVIEGEGVEPRLFAGGRSGLVRPVYVIEADPEQLRETFAARPSGARFLALPAAEQEAVVEMNRRYGTWLQREAEHHGQPWVPSRPWRTLVDRALAATHG
jgi:hypothetical protein